MLLNREVSRFITQESNFINDLIGNIKNRLVFDIGANWGDYSEAYLKAGARVIAIEPDKSSFRKMKVRFMFNKKITLLKKAIADVKETKILYMEGKGSPFNTLSQKQKNVLNDPELNRWNKSATLAQTQNIETESLENLILNMGYPIT